MPIKVVRCPVLGANVTQITDLEGTPTSVICSEYEKPTGLCRLKRRAGAGGPLAQFLERVAEDTLATRSLRCQLQ